MDIRIIIATHKKYWMPSDPMYLPVHVGAAGKDSIEYQRDDEGENISLRNPNYCELTGLFWAWKNLDADYIGLAHYRRHFANGKRFGDKKNKVIDGEALGKIIQGAKDQKIEVFLPTPRNYRIETNYSQYAHAHHPVDLALTRKILSEKYPEALRNWDLSMQRTMGHRFNMFVMSREKLDAYCSWLFDILFELERRLDISSYNSNDRRVFGFVSERLMDVWIETNEIKYKELPYVFMESQNWILKGGRFIMRKFSRQKDGRSA